MNSYKKVSKIESIPCSCIGGRSFTSELHEASAQSLSTVKRTQRIPVPNMKER